MTDMRCLSHPDATKRYQRAVTDGTVMGGGERIVQTEGYVPMGQRIETLMNAGVRLAAARAEQYDADSKTPMEEIVGDRIRNLELLEGLYQTTTISSYIKNKVENQRREHEELKRWRAERAPRSGGDSDMADGNAQKGGANGKAKVDG